LQPTGLGACCGGRGAKGSVGALGGGRVGGWVGGGLGGGCVVCGGRAGVRLRHEPLENALENALSVRMERHFKAAHEVVREERVVQQVVVDLLAPLGRQDLEQREDRVLEQQVAVLQLRRPAAQ
jgi:hypothetical protein